MFTNVLVTGSAGMVGSAICRALDDAGIPYTPVTRTEADFTKRDQVERLFAGNNFDSMIIAAAKVGGIRANNEFPAEFIYENLMIESNLIDAAYRHNVERLLFLGSSCIYPKLADQPIQEESLLTGTLEPTNEPYAIAKIAGIKLCESYNRQYGTDFRCLMPTNLYGPGDNFHPENAHVIPALMDRFHRSKCSGETEVAVWGSGKPRREFLHVHDLALAAVQTLSIDRFSYRSVGDARCSHLNVGTGTDVTISELAHLVRKIVGMDAKLVFDSSKPDGTPRKLLSIDRIKKLGWQPQISLEEGLRETYDWYLAHIDRIRS